MVWGFSAVVECLLGPVLGAEDVAAGFLCLPCQFLDLEILSVFTFPPSPFSRHWEYFSFRTQLKLMPSSLAPVRY